MKEGRTEGGSEGGRGREGGREGEEGEGGREGGRGGRDFVRGVFCPVGFCLVGFCPVGFCPDTGKSLPVGSRRRNPNHWLVHEKYVAFDAAFPPSEASLPFLRECRLLCYLRYRN